MLSSNTVRGRAVAARAPSTLVSRNVTVAGHRTSMRLEPAVWGALGEICERERTSIAEIATAIGRDRSASSLTSAVRVYVLDYFRAAATDEGHRRAGHGFGGSHAAASSRLAGEPTAAVAAADHHHVPV
jgi:predicted DNA-binding ribbon-helix-helix protein